MNGLRDYRVLSLFTKHISHFNIFYCVVIVFFYNRVRVHSLVVNCHTISPSKLKLNTPQCINISRKTKTRSISNDISVK